ncbi:MAG: serine/threonine-protein phosphatase [Clostridiaceae bacterium]|nr:serine/threonine-protein phosphatase [Clostridiaceae bacterium]
MFLTNLIYGEYSDKGAREDNEDAFFSIVKDELAVFSVADGMGGYNLGAEVSRAIINALKREFELCDRFSVEYVSQLLYKKYIQINKSIYQRSISNSIITGSTVTTLCFVENKFILANVGDTKICRIRNNEVITLSKIHNVAAEQYESGLITYLEYRKHSEKNILTQCIGIEGNINPYLAVGDFLRGDYYFICSDGLHYYVDEDDFLDVFLDKTIDTKEQMSVGCKDLILKAYRNGSKDNMTMVAIKFV